MENNIKKFISHLEKNGYVSSGNIAYEYNYSEKRYYIYHNFLDELIFNEELSLRFDNLVDSLIGGYDSSKVVFLESEDDLNRINSNEYEFLTNIFSQFHSFGNFSELQTNETKKSIDKDIFYDDYLDIHLIGA